MQVKIASVTAFRRQKFGGQIRFLLACLYCQKQLKTKINQKLHTQRMLHLKTKLLF